MSRRHCLLDSLSILHELNISITAAERYQFLKVEADGKDFLSDLLKYCKECKLHDVENETTEMLLKLGSKENIAKWLLCAV
jgi:hypothetical protein